MEKCRICPVALGLALGVMWGVSIAFMGLLAHYSMYGRPFVEAMGALYIGYHPSVAGSLIGGLIGFIDAFIGGAIIAWLYNMFCKCRNKHCG